MKVKLKGVTFEVSPAQDDTVVVTVGAVGQVIRLHGLTPEDLATLGTAFLQEAICRSTVEQ